MIKMQYRKCSKNEYIFKKAKYNDVKNYIISKHSKSSYYLWFIRI